MDSDRVEKLVAQVLEETRAFRQEVKGEIRDLREEMKGEIHGLRGEFDGLRGDFHDLREEMNGKFGEVRRDIGLLQTAVLEVSGAVKRVEARLDETIANHGARLDKLEGAAE